MKNVFLKSTVYVEIFRVVVVFKFVIFLFIAKISPHTEITYLWRHFCLNCEICNYVYHIDDIIMKFYPSKNNHVFSMYITQ